MTKYLPPNLLALFAPREPIPFLPPPDKLPHEKKTAGYTGVSSFLDDFEDPRDTPEPYRLETREERIERKKNLQAELVTYKLEQDIALWAPHTNTYATSDAYKTLFVARINYDTSESKLRREFEKYGPIKKIVIVHDKQSGKPRGYAFIEYERGRDMHSAYKHADGKKIDNRRVLVDVERGRTVKGWLPRRLGGGLGGTRRGGPDVNVKYSGRDDARDDRYMERERERPERSERRRSKSRERERRRRSRSRERHWNDSNSTTTSSSSRHKRDRSRERGHEHEVANEQKPENPEAFSEGIPAEVSEKKERRRSRSRDKERRRRRSRSRDRKKRDRDRDMRRQDHGDRDDRVKEESATAESDMETQFNNKNTTNNGDFDERSMNNFNEYEGEEENNGTYNMY